MPVLIDFAVSHLTAAVYFARASRDIEVTGDRSRFTQNESYVIGSIITSVAFMEATVNEVLGASRGEAILVSRAPRSKTMAILGGVAPYVDRLPVLQKYQVALACLQAKQFKEGEAPLQRADLLIRLRNALVHSRPEWVGMQDEPEGAALVRLGRKLKPEFPATKLLPAIAGNPYFPDKCLGFGCARWAVQVARALTDQFSEHIAGKFAYESVLQLDPTAYDVSSL